MAEVETEKRTIQVSRTPMVDFEELETRGWARATKVTTGKAMLELAKTLGCPVPSPSGDLVKEIRVTPVSKARHGTLSELYGVGAFPLHTDTAFWPVPARYVILRASGDPRRHTIVCPFENVFCGIEKPLHILA